MNLSSLNSLSDQVSSIPQATPVHKKLSLTDHKEYVLGVIKKWCFQTKEHLDSENFHLVEDIDFGLKIDLDHNNGVTMSMKCKWGNLVSLEKSDRKIHVSNYNKHFKSRGCFHIRSLKTVVRDLTTVQQQASTLTMSLSSNHLRASSTKATVISPTALPISSLSGPPLNQINLH